MLAEQERIFADLGSAEKWDRLEMFAVAAAAAAGVVAAAVATPAVAAAVGLGATASSLVGGAAGTSSAVAALGGWTARKRVETPEARPLNGASMFATASHELDELVVHVADTQQVSPELEA